MSGIDSPANRNNFVPTQDAPWTDTRVYPGVRLLGFFVENGSGWDLRIKSFNVPLDYMNAPPHSDLLQAQFKTVLADKEAIKQRRKELDEAGERSRKTADEHK